ncbi:MAG: 6-pyruvoyltetrahydropterin/6-carboxytetrahydropterin synthase [Glaciecola sp.]|jgi:6-pyruvoyltetrahydropterin/6-carboxytetrahydropterin synthase
MTSPQVRITHCQDFSAAHRLHAPGLSEAENLEIYGPCHSLHGHNYRFEVSLQGPVDPVTGMVMNLNDLAEIMRTEIWQHVDHKNLGEDVLFLKGVVTTAENLAIAFWNQLMGKQERFGNSRLTCVRVVESPGNFVDYFGEA